MSVGVFWGFIDVIGGERESNFNLGLFIIFVGWYFGSFRCGRRFLGVVVFLLGFEGYKWGLFIILGSVFILGLERGLRYIIFNNRLMGDGRRFIFLL